MKKKQLLALLLSAAMTVTTVAPVSAAEFISEPVVENANFNVDVAEATPEINDVVIRFIDKDSNKEVGKFTVQAVGEDGEATDVYFTPYMDKIPDGYEFALDYDLSKAFQFVIGGDSNFIMVKETVKPIEFKDVEIKFIDKDSNKEVGKFTVQAVGNDGEATDVYFTPYMDKIPDGYEFALDYDLSKAFQFVIGGDSNFIMVKETVKPIEFKDVEIKFIDKDSNKEVGKFTVQAVGNDGEATDVYFTPYMDKIPDGYEFALDYDLSKAFQFVIGGDSNFIMVKETVKPIEFKDVEIKFIDKDSNKEVGKFTVQAVGNDGEATDVYFTPYMDKIPDGYEFALDYDLSKAFQFVIGGDSNFVMVKKAEKPVEFKDVVIKLRDAESNKDVAEFTVQVVGEDGGIADVYMPVFLDKYMPEGYELALDYDLSKAFQFVIGGDSNFVMVKESVEEKVTVVLDTGSYGTLTDGKDIASIEIAEGEEFKLPKVTAKKGYKFTNWKYSYNKVEAPLPVGRKFTYENLKALANDNNCVAFRAEYKKEKVKKQIIVTYTSKYGYVNKAEKEKSVQYVLTEGEDKIIRCPYVYSKRGPKYTNVNWTFKGTDRKHNIDAGKKLNYKILSSCVSFDKDGIAHLTINDRK